MLLIDLTVMQSNLKIIANINLFKEDLTDNQLANSVYTKESNIIYIFYLLVFM